MQNLKHIAFTDQVVLAMSSFLNMTFTRAFLVRVREPREGESQEENKLMLVVCSHRYSFMLVVNSHRFGRWR